MDSPGITQCCPRSSLPRLRLSLWWAWHLNSVPRPSMTGTCSHWLWVKTLVPKRYPKIAGWWMMMDGYSPKYGFSWVLTQPLFLQFTLRFLRPSIHRGNGWFHGDQPLGVPMPGVSGWRIQSSVALLALPLGGFQCVIDMSSLFHVCCFTASLFATKPSSWLDEVLDSLEFRSHAPGKTISNYKRILNQTAAKW